MRVVSLLPSATELLCAAGAADLLVGRSHECDHPAEIADRPVLTGQRLDPAASPSEIDAAVREQLQTRSSLYTLDVDRMVALRPDLILTQDLCKVCSIDVESVHRAVHRVNPAPRVLSLDPESVEDVLDDLLRVGQAVGREKSASEAVVRLRERMFRAADYVASFALQPRVAFLEWTDPLFIGGHWTPQLIERAGAEHPLNPTVPVEDAGAAAGPMQSERRAGKSVRIPPEALIAMQPECLVVCPCGVGLDGGGGGAQSVRQMTEALSRKEWWGELPAVRMGRVAMVDGNQMFNRPGPRLVDAYEWLVGWLNDRPELILPGFPWARWEG